MHFGDLSGDANAMAIAEHFVRYAGLAPFVKGRRVLDIACGEGYGSWLLKEWGASFVVGVDISEEAISVAKQRFSREGVEYVRADACNAAELLQHASFDIVASFETIEHVHDPVRLLEGIRSLAAPGAQIFVSCPNDHAAFLPSESNPYHIRKYTFDEFKECSENVLGPANQWLLGVNVQGYALISEMDPLIQSAHRIGCEIVSAAELSSAHLLPSQRNIRPDRTNVLYYVGVWGVTQSISTAALSAQSYVAFIEPWKALDWFRAERRSMQEKSDDVSTALVQLREQVEAGLPTEPSEAQRQIAALHRLIAKIGTDARLQDARAAKAAEAEAEQRLEILSIRHYETEQKLEELGARHNEAEQRLKELDARHYEAEQRLGELRARYDAILRSKSWRLTRVLRGAARLLRGELPHGKRLFLKKQG